MVGGNRVIAEKAAKTYPSTCRCGGNDSRSPPAVVARSLLSSRFSPFVCLYPRAKEPRRVLDAGRHSRHAPMRVLLHFILDSLFPTRLTSPTYSRYGNSLRESRYTRVVPSLFERRSYIFMRATVLSSSPRHISIIPLIDDNTTKFSETRTLFSFICFLNFS